MPSTPPPTSLRARTPPTPLHGPDYDNYEPYSPRRSKRSTAHSNPYSSFNGERSPKSSFQHVTTPPATVKRARFARAPTQLSSPPSSPASPVKRHTPQHRTPRKQTSVPRRPGHGAQSDSDGPSHKPLAPPTIDPVTMLPTPSKTPRRQLHNTTAISSSARILSFQPNHPNDVMPSPRKIKKQKRSRATSGFELYEDEEDPNQIGRGIAIYTDANARVPEMDESEDNPFVGRKKSSPRPQRKRGRKGQAELESEQRINEAVKRDEGVTYVFRGKKIFRRFEDGASDAGTDLSGTPEQRRLKRQAGAAAQRPLTKSAIKPRLLFPSEEQLLEREQQGDEVDEEAATDIEMPNQESKYDASATTPVNTRFTHSATLASPPTTTRATRSSKKLRASASPTLPTLMVGEEFEPMSVGDEASFTSATTFAGKRKARSPFDSWQRTKAGRKRAGSVDLAAEGSGGVRGKRSRSAAIESPA